MKDICGIYTIVSKIDNKIYIGSSYDIYLRLRKHKESLKRNTHHNIHLQRAYNKYGENNFVFDILEECEEDIRLDIENYWINILNTKSDKFGYNIGNPLMNTLEYKSKKVDCYNLNGEFIKTYNSIIKASIDTNSDSSVIAKICKRKNNYINGKIFRYHKEPLGDIKTCRGTKIKQLDLDGNLIKIWDGMAEAARYVNCSPSSISKVCMRNTKNKTAKNFKWEYYEI